MIVHQDISRVTNDMYHYLEAYNFINKLYEQTLPERTLLSIDGMNSNRTIGNIIDRLHDSLLDCKINVENCLKKYISEIFYNVSSETISGLPSLPNVMVQHGDNQLIITTAYNDIIVNGTLSEQVEKILAYDLTSYMNERYKLLESVMTDEHDVDYYKHEDVRVKLKGNPVIL